MEKRKKLNIRNEAETLKKQGRGPIRSDILGSYTGTGEYDDIPEQDADDL